MCNTCTYGGQGDDRTLARAVPLRRRPRAERVARISKATVYVTFGSYTVPDGVTVSAPIVFYSVCRVASNPRFHVSRFKRFRQKSARCGIIPLRRGFNVRSDPAETRVKFFGLVESRRPAVTVGLSSRRHDHGRQSPANNRLRTALKTSRSGRTPLATTRSASVFGNFSNRRPRL